MNRKRKFNELYKGVFKNDKKSCLIDLKPLDKKREIEKDLNKEKEDGMKMKNVSKEAINPRNPNKSRLGVNLRVAKNLGFGSFFRKVREEIVDIFLSKEEFISFDGLINSNSVNDLFNFRDSTSKNFIDKEIINLENISKLGNPQSYLNIADRTTELIKRQEEFGIVGEEILYEDECETIYKKRKMPQGVSNKKIQFYYDENMNVNYDCDEIEAENIPQKYFNLGNLKNLDKMNNNSLNFPQIEKISQRGNNLGNFTNLSNLSSNNILSSLNHNQFIPTINKQERLMTNRNLLEFEDEDNFALHKLKQHMKKNKISSHLLLSQDNSAVGDLVGMKMIKQTGFRGPLSNITNKFDD